MVPRTEPTPAGGSPAIVSAAPQPGSQSSFRALAGGLTPLDAGSASRHLAQGYRALTGSSPSPGTLDLLWAQWALETARGQAMYGNNFGGIKAGSRGPAALLATTEGYGRHEKRIRDRFRTYATPEDGARDYVSLLARRYPAAFAALERGDADGFAAGLHRGRYFTANPQSYRAALQRLAEEHRLGPSNVRADPVTALALEGLRWALEKARDD